MTHSVLIHLMNEDPILAEIEALPDRQDQILVVQNPRRRMVRMCITCCRMFPRLCFLGIALALLRSSRPAVRKRSSPSCANKPAPTVRAVEPG